jgi:hypothetical protein
MKHGSPPELDAAIEAARIRVSNGADAATLYQQWFHEVTGIRVEWPSVAEYRAAIADAHRFERGWVVVSSVTGLAGGVVVQRGGRQRMVAPPEVTPDDPRCLTLVRGSRVRVDPIATSESGGFWHAWSAVWQAQPPERFERFYFRVPPEQACLFALRLVRQLPRRPAWAMKVLCGTHDAGRRDNALLYLPAGATLKSIQLRQLISSMFDLCAGELPPFVHSLGFGFGWAPDPGGGRSFGEAVSHAVAQAADQSGDPVAFAQTVRAGVDNLPGMARRLAVAKRWAREAGNATGKESSA